MPINSQLAVERLRKLEQMFRAAQAQSDAAFRSWEEARQELAAASMGLQQATRGLRHGTVQPDAEGKAVITVERQVREPVDRGGVQTVDIRYEQHHQREPRFDNATLRLHEAQQDHERTRDAMNEAGGRAGRFRRPYEEAAQAITAAGTRLRPGTASPSKPTVVSGE
jgi:hypothetical protein